MHLTRRWKSLLLATAIAAMGLWVGPSQAGYQAEYSVKVGATYACGSLGTARNSANSTEYISCSVYAENAQGSVAVSCDARDASGNTASCNTNWQTAPALLPAISAMNGDSYVCFIFDKGACRSISTQNGSQFAPKKN